MRYILEDLLEETDLAALTGEVLEEPVEKPKGRNWKRLGALAACAVFIAGALNYSALAAGVDKLVRYLTGVGAVEAGVGVYTMEEPVTWTDGDWSYCAEIMRYGKYALVSFRQATRAEEPSVSDDLWPEVSYVEGKYGPSIRIGNSAGGGDSPHLWYQIELLADGEPLLKENWWSPGTYFEENEEAAITDNERMEGVPSHSFFQPCTWTPDWETGDGWTYYSFLNERFRVGDREVKEFVLRISSAEGRLLWEKTLCPTPVEAQSAIVDTYPLPKGGQVMALAAEDGRSVSFYTDQNAAIDEFGRFVKRVSPDSGDSWVFFVGASGTSYNGKQSASTSVLGFGPSEYVVPEDVQEPITAIVIKGLEVVNALPQSSTHRYWYGLEKGWKEVREFYDIPETYTVEDIEWVIEIP